MAGDVEARASAGLDVQVLGDTAGDVRSPARIAARVSQWLGQMEDVHAGGGGELSQRDHAATLVSASAQASATVGVGPNSQARASARLPASVRT